MPPVTSPVRVLAGELLGVGAGSGCGAPLASPSIVIVGTVIDGTCRQPRLQLVVLRLAVGEPEPPAVVVDHDG